MTFVGTLGSPNNPQRFTPGGTRGRIQGANNTVSYPSPWFDLAQTYMPRTVKAMFQECRYFFMSSGPINAAVFKLSEYPVTEVEVEHEDPQTRKRWKEYLENTARIRAFLVEVGLDHNVFGNAAVSMNYPFKKYLSCESCGYMEQALRIPSRWSYNSGKFRLHCPKCSHRGPAKQTDFYYKDISKLKPVRWDVQQLDIRHNELTGEQEYWYNIPRKIRSAVTLGKKEVIATLPKVMLYAIYKKKSMKMSSDNFFHLRRPTLCGYDQGWGMPLLLPVLRNAFYLNLMRKAQEAILLERIVPMNVLFPQAGSGTSDPWSLVNLDEWRDAVAGEIARWRNDPNYYPIMPLPIGHQTIGGDGKALMLQGEMQMVVDEIIMGMGAPTEFLRGGLSYSGSNVSLRMLENSMINYIGRLGALVRWIVEGVGNFMEWPIPHVYQKPFKMADDIQRKQLLLQMNSESKLSDSTLLAAMDLSMEEEDGLMDQELDRRLASTKKQQIAMADIQGEAAAITMKYQLEAQMAAQSGASQQMPAPGEPAAPEAPLMSMEQATEYAAQSVPAAAQSPLNASQNMEQQMQQGVMPVSVEQLAQAYAQQLLQLPPDQQQMALQSMENTSPQLAQAVEFFLKRMGGAAPQEQQGPQESIDMRPLPEALPPRRTNSPI